jgi:hypothetical protein
MLNLDNFAHSNVLENEVFVLLQIKMSAKVMYHSPHIIHHHLEPSLSLSSQNSYAKVAKEGRFVYMRQQEHINHIYVVCIQQV